MSIPPPPHLALLSPLSPSSLKTSLAASQEKLKVLEQQLDNLLAEKNSRIRTLESRAQTAERELAAAKASLVTPLDTTLILLFLLRMLVYMYTQRKLPLSGGCKFTSLLSLHPPPLSLHPPSPLTPPSLPLQQCLSQ